MIDLRQSLSQQPLDDEPPLPDITSHVIAAGLRLRARRRIVVGATGTGLAAVIVAAVAVPLAVAGGSSGHTQAIQIAASPTTTPSAAATTAASPTATTSAAGLGFNAAGPVPRCAAGQLPAVSADMARVVVHGIYDHSDQSWADQYLKPDPTQRAIGSSVAAVNGHRPSPSTSYLWVVSGPATSSDYTTSVLLVRTSDTTWSGHPATFTGCKSAAR